MRSLRKTDYIAIAVYTVLSAIFISSTALLFAVQESAHNHSHSVQVNGSMA